MSVISGDNAVGAVRILSYVLTVKLVAKEIRQVPEMEKRKLRFCHLRVNSIRNSKPTLIPR